MSAVGLRTKKVTTYGKKKTQIISIHTDFARNNENAAIASPSSPFPASATTITKRPPLQAKLSQDTINIPSTPLPPSKIFKGKATKLVLPESPLSSPELIVKYVRRRVARPGRAVIPRSPSASPARATPRIGSRQKEVFDGVVIPSARKSKLSQNLIESFSEITIEDEPATPLDFAEKPSAPATSKTLFADLISTCSAATVQPFNAFLHSSTIVPTSTPSIRKVGEASYSEVFGISSSSSHSDELVLKVIPLLPDVKQVPVTNQNLPDCSTVADVLREIEITKRMSELQGGGFVRFQGAYVVEGPYPSELLDQWDLYKSTVGSASIRPGGFDSTQRYALVVLSNSGLDLEAFKFDSSRGWVQAAGIFWQLADALARAERWTRFEHRDLHEGQILLSPVPIDEHEVEDYLSSSYTGIQSTIIDFGLSRLDVADGSVAYTSLPEEVYEGKGRQWDVYRFMRERIDDWEEYLPITNVMWLHYILQYMLDSKSLKKIKPKTQSHSTHSPAKTNQKQSRRKARQPTTSAIHALQAERANAMLLQGGHVLSSALRSKEQARTRTRRGAEGEIEVEGGIHSAGDLVRWGKEMGWIA